MRLCADEQVGVVYFWKVAQNLRDALRRQLARSARARSVVNQAFFSAKEQHSCSPYKKTHGSKTVGLSRQAILQVTTLQLSLRELVWFFSSYER